MPTVSIEPTFRSIGCLSTCRLVSSFRTRVMTKCGLEVVESEHPFCDRYSFFDPQSGEETEYYIYIGNWP
jgi:hypothetical protein